MTEAIGCADAGAIVVVGGYGVVGRGVVEALAPRLPGRILIAGRDRRKAEALAWSIGHGARALELASDPSESLARAAVVVMCAEMQDGSVARRCLEAGAHYVDITATPVLLEQLEALSPVARAAGATALVSVGLAPGLSHALAVAAARELTEPARVDVFVSLGMGDHHGPAALAWTLARLDHAFEIDDAGGGVRRVRAFGESSRFCLPGERRARRAYRFELGDDRRFARRHALPSCSTWLCLDSRLATGALALAVRGGAGRLLAATTSGSRVVRLLGRARLGSDRWVLCARASAAASVVEVCATGRREASASAGVAAAAVLHLLAGGAPPGVFHLDERLPLESLLEELQPLGLGITVTRQRPTTGAERLPVARRRK